TSNATNRSGVVGLNANNVGVFGRGVTGLFGVGQAGRGFTTGVLGADHDWGARGISDGGLGVAGAGGDRQRNSVGLAGGGGDGYSVRATSDTSIGILAACGDDSGNRGVAAGVFAGDVLVNGPLTVTGGVNSAAIRHRDGSHRRLYSLESPESWFE